MTGGSPTTLVTFNYSNGSSPDGDLVLSGNTLYGTASHGETGGLGTVFSVPVTGGSPTTLASFNDANGAYAGASLILSGNTLYATTLGNPLVGTSGGTVFSVSVTGGSPTTLATFNYSNGSEPQCKLISGSTLYGTTFEGGDSTVGTVFSVPVTSGSPTTLATFNNSNGADPVAGVILSGSTLYGTAPGGGAGNDGTVFSVPTTGGPITTLVAFNRSNGHLPAAASPSGNTFYGTTERGGATNYGTIFSAPMTGGSPTTLATFNSFNGEYPSGDLTVSGNTLYGTTSNGGVNGRFYADGTVFSLTYNHALLSTAAPANFGGQVGTVHVSGSYSPGSASFSTTPTGYLAVAGFNPSTETEVYALELTDSVPASLHADLADAASKISAGTYFGYSVTASTVDPTGIFDSGYDFYVTIINYTLATSSPYFGFDFMQLNGTNDMLSVSAVAAALPELASLGLLAIGGIALLGRWRIGEEMGWKRGGR